MRGIKEELGCAGEMYDEVDGGGGRGGRGGELPGLAVTIAAAAMNQLQAQVQCQRQGKSSQVKSSQIRAQVHQAGAEAGCRRGVDLVCGGNKDKGWPKTCDIMMILQETIPEWLAIMTQSPGLINLCSDADHQFVKPRVLGIASSSSLVAPLPPHARPPVLAA